MPPGLFGRRCAVSALKGKRKTRISYKLASNHSSPAVSGPERLGCLYYTGSERALPEHPVEPRLISVLLLNVPKDQLDVWRSAVATERLGIGFEVVTHVYSQIGQLRVSEDPLQGCEEDLDHVLVRSLSSVLAALRSLVLSAVLDCFVLLLGVFYF